MNMLVKLFFAFIQVGLFSVGGGYAAIPLIQAQIVNIHRFDYHCRNDSRASIH